MPEQAVLLVLRDLRRQLVVAARRDDDRLGAEPNAGCDRLVGRGVARVQRDEQVDRLVALVGVDRRRLEARLVVAEAVGDRRAPSRSPTGCCRDRRARRASPPRGRRRRARGSCTPCRSRRRRLGSARGPRAAAGAGARRSAAPDAPCRVSSSSRRRADGRPAAGAAARGRAARSPPPATTASRSRRASGPSSSGVRARRRPARAGGRSSRRRAAHRGGRASRRAARSRCAGRRRS